MILNPRRPLDADSPDGYAESDKDFVLNNLELAVALLEALSVEQEPVAWLVEGRSSRNKGRIELADGADEKENRYWSAAFPVYRKPVPLTK